MKKTIFALFAVLLALSLATCDLLDPEDGGRSVAEKGMVSLTINIKDGNTSRAVSSSTAPGATTKYEVVFKDTADNQLYRFTANGTTSVPVKIPMVNYVNTAEAIVFAGTSGNTLLGIGIITEYTTKTAPTVPVSVLPGGTITVDDETNGITFTLTALTSGVTAGLGSSFHLVGPTNASSADPKSQGNFSTTGGGAAAIGNKSGIPLFNLPAGKFTNTGSNDPVPIGSGNTSLDVSTINTTTSIVGRYTITCGVNGNNYKGAIINPAGGWTVNSSATITEVGSDPKIAVPVTKLFPRNADTAMPSDGSFYFNINLAAIETGGYSKIVVEVPVVAISTGNGINYAGGSQSAIAWTIKGGTDDAKFDGYEYTASIPETDGGAVLLFVPDPSPDSDTMWDGSVDLTF